MKTGTHHATPRRSNRFYRDGHRTGKWVNYEVKYRETDLWIRAEQPLEKPAMDAVLNCRHQLESYISQHREFSASLAPLPDDPTAPPIVRRMLQAALDAGVGPMATVAGAIAEWVGREIMPAAGSVIVENGGDCYLDVHEEIRVGVYAGPDSPFRGKIGLRFTPERFPLGICTSSGTIGHSVSFGKADAVVAVARNTALADAAATAVGNLVRTPSSIGDALELAARIPSLEGVLILIEDKMGVWGNLELV